MHAFEFLQKFLDEMMVNHTKYLAPLVRTWNPNVLDQVIELLGKGRTAKTLTIEERISVFNILTSDKNYSRYVRLIYILSSHANIQLKTCSSSLKVVLDFLVGRNVMPYWIA